MRAKIISGIIVIVCASLFLTPFASVAAANGPAIYVAGDESHVVDIFSAFGQKLASHDLGFTRNDRIATGDIDGDGIPEILIAGDASNIIDIFDRSGSRPYPKFDGAYTGNDGFAVGDIDGDGIAEILVAGDESHSIDIFDRFGNRPYPAFNGGYTVNDGFALGDLDGDGIDEIIVAGDDSHILDIFDRFGNRPVPAFDGGFTENDGLAIADIDGDGAAEILIAGDVSHAVDIFDRNGNRPYPAFNGHFTANDRFAAGDIDGDGVAEILIAGDDSHIIDVFDRFGNRPFPAFNGTFTIYDGFTVDRSTGDRDGDGLLDVWENNGIDFDRDGAVDLHLYDVNGDGMITADEQADPAHEDLYIEVDFMAQHNPNATAIGHVVTAFANAPVRNPDGATGIRLHVQVDEQAVAHNASLAFPPACTPPATVGVPTFDATKAAFFGTAAERMDPNSAQILGAKRLISRYALFAHSLQDKGTTSGCAELPGNDFVISLGGWAVVGGHDVGNTDQQEGTFMHELGHTLNLHHGGDEEANCKPNYLSVMSYGRQTSNRIVGRPLDYSREALAVLYETNLSEMLGIGGPVGDQTAFGPPPITVVAASGAINWNGVGGIESDTVEADINNFGINGCMPSSGETLDGFDDWSNLVYDFRLSSDFADGVHVSMSSTPELTHEDVMQIGYPVARAGSDSSAECTSHSGAVVVLDGSASFDPDSDEQTNDIASYEWFENYGGPNETMLGTGESLTIALPIGRHVVTLRVTDTLRHTSTDDVVMTISDSGSPTVSVRFDPATLWPPNHKLLSVQATLTAVDACDAHPTVVLEHITSNEPDSGLGNGDKPNDIQRAAFGTADLEFLLRAERSGSGTGRIYTMSYSVRDASSNVTRATAIVRVPHDNSSSQ